MKKTQNEWIVESRRFAGLRYFYGTKKEAESEARKLTWEKGYRIIKRVETIVKETK